jgi:hypothetical protein
MSKDKERSGFERRLRPFLLAIVVPRAPRHVGAEADAARREARAISWRRTLPYLPGDSRDQGGMKAR